MTTYATSLKIEREPNDPSTDGFFTLQPWYPRVWDEWARDKDGALPADIYAEADSSIDIGETEILKFRIPAVLPTLAEKDAYHGDLESPGHADPAPRAPC
jgi:hypothetical protein